MQGSSEKFVFLLQSKGETPMKNNATCTIRSEEITIDVRICAALAANRCRNWTRQTQPFTVTHRRMPYR